MSRIGKQLIDIPTGVTVIVNSNEVTVTGPKGELKLNVAPKINVEIKDNQVFVTRVSEDKKTRSNHGTTRAHINNMIKGVVTPWEKTLEIKGTGYKAVLMGNKIRLNVGYIHPVDIEAPVGVTFQVPEDTKVIVSGCNKTVVGQVASNIRKVRKPEPYKGKGIRYADEFIKLKAGKKAKA
ncbi:MAG: 50S ribosomal protein L6 [Candidatus Shapirobacteria bacterium]|nr:50S ribosomal protein L6 [Candidatus Shapirobacteria bacterium]MDD3003232.1 50S ribosomal protein L6 [Candidatus Shapirobacteria bacterium]MDD4383097.1 50S ribosomal protein L6 [Candidatus Shapirobacteria bacterium]